jgi:NAD(P)-dependent dehydrogenase (short-subunit alcohol dehydrogenase family)
MNNKVILLTGSTSGIGEAAVKELVRSASALILPVRNITKGEELKQILNAINPSCIIDLYECDFSSLKSVKKMIENVRKNYKVIDVLANNAGLFNGRIVMTEDGIEETFQVNVLSQYLLNSSLLDLVQVSTSGRIVNLSSLGHKGGKFDLDNLNCQKENNNLGGGSKAYFNSNLYRNLLTAYYADQLKSNGSKVTVNCMHPGAIKTGLGVQNKGYINGLLIKLFGVFTKPATAGAKTLIYLCLSDEVKDISGQYFVNSKVDKANPESMDLASASMLVQRIKESIVDK